MLRVTLALAALAAALAATAGAAGPAAGEAASLTAGSVRYLATPAGAETRLETVSVRDRHLLRSTRLAGRWGIPRVAFDGATEGLSNDRSTLVLAWRTQGTLANPSRFAIVDPKTLRLRRVVSLRGRFAFDALSPDASRLYLVEYVSVVGEQRYRVRSYDLRAGRLLQGAIADKRSGWTAMEGMPLARARSTDGSWAYTLYGNTMRPFVHALNTSAGYAVCVDLPLEPGQVQGLRLRVEPTQLVLVTKQGTERAAIDRTTLRVLPA